MLPSILISENEIQKRVNELACRISKDYPDGVYIVGVLNGSRIFMTDLVKKLKVPASCSFIKASSYGKLAQSNGKVEIDLKMIPPLKNKRVLIVEDIIDTGLTLEHIRDTLLLHSPIDLKICVLLDKPSRRIAEINVNYIGFTIEDKFVVGYGMDYNEQYRDLPDIRFISDFVV
ncbi:hypoxanthine phosphoribosyltransferase [Candidatus Desantisbacteria bacterium]|nr:hypoxanthine phosphoribosyltransferase [Candidatus Desantisbacteria bacterium]